MKYIKTYESKDFNEIEEQLNYIFLDLVDNNFEVKVSITHDFNRKPIGFSIRISKGEKINLSDIYTCILTSIDYMRNKGIRFRAIRSDFNGSMKIMSKYFYDYMSGDVPDVSFNKCIILFE